MAKKRYTVRGHWEATADCDRAIEVSQPKMEEVSVECIQQLEATLEKADAQATEQQQFNEVVVFATDSIEVDSVKLDSYRIWAGSELLGTMRRTSTGWMARALDGAQSWHPNPGAAQFDWQGRAAIPPRPIDAHPCLKAAEIASIEDGDSRDSVETPSSKRVFYREARLSRH